jgi:hypothetical protein
MKTLKGQRGLARGRSLRVARLDELLPRRVHKRVDLFSKPNLP